MKIGPARVPVTAISPKPRFVIATSAVMSPKQLPHATIVNASNDSGRLVTNPNVCSKSIITFDENYIHIMLITKASIEYIVINYIGALLFLVFNKINKQKKKPGIMAYKPI